MTGKKERVVHCWDKTGLLGAWKQSNGVDAVTRAAELFPNLRAERRGADDAPPADGDETHLVLHDLQVQAVVRRL